MLDVKISYVKFILLLACLMGGGGDFFFFVVFSNGEGRGCIHRIFLIKYKISTLVLYSKHVQ